VGHSRRPKTTECEKCGHKAKYTISPCKFVVKGGADEPKRVRKQLVKRSLDHDKTPQAKEERRQRIREMSEKGYPMW
jgi:hypothetical protein